MSTRGCYRFTDEHGSFTVYKHHDNYPEGPHGGIAAIEAATEFAWPLPRFEADDFAAAFVSANKLAAGSVRLLNTPAGPPSLEHMPSDIEYLYDVSVKTRGLHVIVSSIEGGWGGKPLTATRIQGGDLAAMVRKFVTDHVQ